MNNQQIQLRCMIIIITRGAGDKVASLIEEYTHFQSIFLGRGTANSEIRATLGMYEPEKDILMCFIDKSNVQNVYDILEETCQIRENHSGVAMTIPVNAVGGKKTLALLAGLNEKI